MGKVSDYELALGSVEDWDAYLLSESGLPGPRANIELARAAANMGSEEQIAHWLSFDVKTAPVNSPAEFLAFCGVLGLGRVLVEGKLEQLGTLRRLASDPRWRVREAVAMALQQLGRTDMDRLLAEMARWSSGNPFERRAAAAALCEPSLLMDESQAEKVLRLLDGITASISETEDRKAEGFEVLKKGLAYCWSVAVVAYPEVGKDMMEAWCLSADRDVRWIMAQNLKKKRLAKMDAEWVGAWVARLADQSTGLSTA